MVTFGCRICLIGQIFVDIIIDPGDGRRRRAAVIGTELFLLVFMLTMIIELEVYRVFIVHSNPLIVITVYQVIHWIIVNAKTFTYELLLL